MRFHLNSDIATIRDDLKKASKELALEDVLNWNSTIWAHLIAIASGLDPFAPPAINIIPDVMRAFVPRKEFKPTLEDKKHAYLALWRGITCVNKAIVETTKGAYDQFQSGPIPNILEAIQNSFPGGLDDFLKHLENELLDYEKRKMYVQAGYSMMTEEQAWLSRHHTLAVAIVSLVNIQPKRTLSTEEFLSLAHDAGLLENGKVTYNPISGAKKEKIPAENLEIDKLSQALQDAEANAEKSKQKLLDSLKKPKKK
jgi:hypothetical protein